MKLPQRPEAMKLYAMVTTRNKPFLFYSEAQMLDYGQQCRDDALDEAAHVCDKQWTATQCANAIHALK